MKDFTQLAQERYSVRSYKPDPIPEDVLRQILEAGRLAPTAKNYQPYHVYVLKSEAALKTINEITNCAYHAPVVLMFCGVLDQAFVDPWNGHNGAEMDVSIVATHMMLKAADMGIGSCWVCWYDSAKVKEAFHLPENEEPYCLLPLGYPSEEASPSERHALRKSLEEVVTEL